LLRVRGSLDKAYVPLVDVCIAHHVLYFAGGVFEGYITARVGSNLVFMIIFAAIANHLIRYAPRAQADTAETDWEEEGAQHEAGEVDDGAVSAA
jgi:hypothetical protein